MDTPGFDAYQQEHAFDSIVNGIRAVKSAHPDARIAGILYITGVNQPRFEDLDHQLFWFVHAFCGDAFIKRGLIFVTTFWTATGDGQKRAFMSKLEQLQIKWNEGDAVAMPEFYNHGCGYDADGKLDGSFIDWFSESGRDQIARHAREMVARYYGDSDTEPATLRIVQELDAGTPIILKGQIEIVQRAPLVTIDGNQTRLLF
ncbi:hypothetical protein SEUCBS140593_000860 [Sporothrix eucalyptigena]|uniref:Uncharacterized protein n=1 Tax=Sporothrix eucalyptigena TaxID=1812306 RepID=A0ABP0ATF5_9PEZI